MAIAARSFAGYRGEQVREQLGDRHGTLALDYSFEQQPLGTGGALRNAAHMLQTPHVLALNGDSYCDMDLAAFAAAHLSYGGDATVAVLHRDDRSRAGAVDLDADGRVVTFASRPVTADPGLINAGLYMFRRVALDAIPQGAPSRSSPRCCRTSPHAGRCSAGAWSPTSSISERPRATAARRSSLPAGR
jgi:NDP-sugar pyrophosphorylase family protein